MRCPFCSSEDTQVVDTRSNEDTNVIRRRRKCPKCDKRFTTYERIEAPRLTVVKRDGTRQEFDREKLVAAGGKAMTLTEAADSHPKGSKVRILG